MIFASHHNQSGGLKSYKSQLVKLCHGFNSRRKSVAAIAAAFLFTAGSIAVAGSFRTASAQLGNNPEQNEANPAEASAPIQDNPIVSSGVPSETSQDYTYDNKSSSSLNIELKTNSVTSSDSAENSSSAQLSINGQDVPVSSSSGSNRIKKRIYSTNGNASVNISVQNSSSSGGDGM